MKRYYIINVKFDNIKYLIERISNDKYEDMFLIQENCVFKLNVHNPTDWDIVEKCFKIEKEYNTLQEVLNDYPQLMLQ